MEMMDNIKVTKKMTLIALIEILKERFISRGEVSYTIAKQETPAEGYAATYQLIGSTGPVGAPINIPRDYLVRSADVKTCQTADEPVPGYKAGDKYIDFGINTPDSSGDGQHIYLLVQELVDVYRSGDGISIGKDNKVCIRLDPLANGLTVGEGGLALSLATEQTPGAMPAGDKVKLDALPDKKELDQLMADKLTLEGLENAVEDFTAAEIAAIFEEAQKDE